ncbi:MAG: UbiA-like polyprenyltransferase [Planctomycetota bacterium]|jgi:4-hydroxybenzoate polyprenyltransferase
MPSFKTYASFVKIAHTIFALPFAVTGMLCAYMVDLHFRDFQGEPLFDKPRLTWLGLAIVLLCMVGARSFAMAINRIIDRHIDSLNPRTAVREIPAGKIGLGHAWAFALVMAGLYFIVCASAGTVVLVLSPIPIVVMIIYPFMKRWHWSCHYVLGVALGLAPVGAWVAMRTLDTTFIGIDNGLIRGGFDVLLEPLPWILGAAVALWVAGFDIIYALQDDEFDRRHELHSVPADFGRKKALLISRLTHVFSGLLFVVFAFLASGKLNVDSVGAAAGLEVPQLSLAAPFIVIAGMFLQHRLVKADDLSKVNMAFFTVNGGVSLLFGLTYVVAYHQFRFGWQ